MATTRVTPFRFAGRELRVHQPAPRFDDLVDEIMDDPDANFPWWALIWPAALALAGHLIDGTPRSGRAIELGCGLGVAGLGGAMSGLAMEMTDLEPMAIRCARTSAIDNQLDIPAPRVLDWFAPGDVEQYPLVIGADVLFEPDYHAVLLALLPRLIAPDGRALLSDPGRSDARPFLERAAKHFDIRVIDERTIRYEEMPYTVQIHQLTWPT